jgi:hypothetical protein
MLMSGVNDDDVTTPAMELVGEIMRDAGDVRGEEVMGVVSVS